jgi:DNA-binding MarR family transcriptional regulator
MTYAPTLTGQDIGEVSAATSRVFDVLLAETETTFAGWLVLNTLDIEGRAVTQSDLAARVALAPGAPQVTDALQTLVPTGLVSTSTAPAHGGTATSGAPATLVTLTDAGAARVEQIRGGIRQIAERLYGDIPAADLVTAHRVLATVTQRANAEAGL